MRKYKVVVYAICKNESKFIKRWVESMSEADEIYVLDTGSSDDSVSLLRDLGVNVFVDRIEPWRFDVARNRSLELVPRDVDICVCTDIDEVFDVGWRESLEKIWDGKSRVRYSYNWVIDENGNSLISYYLDKIHKRDSYVWKYPVHEVLECLDDENIITTDSIVLNHYPDRNKSRSGYLSLLELAYSENSNDPRILHYLGREYMYYNRYDDAIRLLKKHLEVSNWCEERCASMRFIARCYYKKNDISSCLKWYDLSIKEAPHLRDPLVEKAFVLYELKRYNEVIYLCNVALDIEDNKKRYVNEIFSFNGSIEDLLSLCYYYKNNKELALYYVDQAIKIRPFDKRLINNREFFV